MRRAVQAAVAALVLAALVGLAVAVGAHDAAPPDCAALLRQAEHTSDAGLLLEEAGCVEPTATSGRDLTAQP